MEGPRLLVSDDQRILSVGELASGLRRAVESSFADVWVEGEISNLRVPASGHCYFTLKDENAQLRCVMWRSAMRSVSFRPTDGLRVRVRGSATLYEPRGDLQLAVRIMRPAGVGALQQAFEALKKKLADEGLFNAERKRPIPTFPNHIGIVTSGDGAALHDILTIVGRRYPIAQVSTCSVRVQGMGAAEGIARAIDAFSEAGGADRPDVLIVGRGGGSLEDLWAFNEEPVARAIARCQIPVVSAVGHETDFSISDFVADVRAATPSMAAELVTPDRNDLMRRIRALDERLAARHRMRIERLRQRVRHLLHSHVFNRPLDRLRHQQQRVDDLHDRLQRAVLTCSSRQRATHEALAARLELLDPRRPLERGYALVEKNGIRVRRADSIQAADRVTLQFLDGARQAEIQD